MKQAILHIYDFFRRRPLAGWGVFILLTALLTASFLRLGFKEDISDFLPLDEENRTAMAVYQEISGAGHLFAIIMAADSASVRPDRLAEGVEAFAAGVAERDSLGFAGEITKEIDLERILDVADEVYAGIPFYLTEADYSRIDSLLSDPGYVARKIADCKQMLLFPTSDMIAANISRDPLDLFTPVAARLNAGGPAMAYDTYDGYILTPDGSRAIVMVRSAFGANESDHNAVLTSLLEEAAGDVEKAFPDLKVHIAGGPAIAAGNASRIKTDSMMAVAIAGFLILALLVYVFRSARNILLIVVVTGWGWLMAMGCIALFYDSISVIVVGIASVILGIAVNYPLHLIDHLKGSRDPRGALAEIISPLVVGNVTTVGAFLCLVPLSAPALHDLGLFSSLLLAGTILFVLIFLPHAVRTGGSGGGEPALISRIASVKMENHGAVVGLVAVLTLFFAFFAGRTEFDTDMRNINYMTPEQREDMDYFASLTSRESDREKVYLVGSGATWEEALENSERMNAAVDSLEREGLAVGNSRSADFLLSREAKNLRLARWREFADSVGLRLAESVEREGIAQGFSPSAFSPFREILTSGYEAGEFDPSSPLASLAFGGNLCGATEGGRHSVVRVLEVRPEDVEIVKKRLDRSREFGGQCFDVKGMNGKIARTLSEDFNYIGVACGFIVFLFLWLSLGSVELAIVSFLPMAVSWIWILGIMGLSGMSFNIVNVILATFIFGQGDDYTIFITEGLSYEFARRRKVLASYKNSIVVSALIMFIGIGTLIFARHPALRSLGEVTVVGMVSVVVMAWLIPPLVFNFLVKKGGRRRRRPVTLRKVLSTAFCAVVFLVELCAGYLAGAAMRLAGVGERRRRLLLHRMTCAVFRFDSRRMPGIRFSCENRVGEDFSRPAVIVCNHQSMLDPFFLLTLTPKMVVVANDHVGRNRITGLMFRWLGFITVGQGVPAMTGRLRQLVEEGYSVLVFPEGERPASVGNHVKRFHKGAVEFAGALGLDILPVWLHGLLEVMPKGSALSNGGSVVLEVGERVALSELGPDGASDMERTRALRALFQGRYSEMCRRLDTVEYMIPVVYDRYRYKGGDVERAARRHLRAARKQASMLEGLHAARAFVVEDECSQGEVALLLALMYPDRFVTLLSRSVETRELAEGCAVEFAPNLVVAEGEGVGDSPAGDALTVRVTETAAQPGAGRDDGVVEIGCSVY